jgi:hypothetical protein
VPKFQIPDSRCLILTPEGEHLYNKFLFSYLFIKWPKFASNYYLNTQYKYFLVALFWVEVLDSNLKLQRFLYLYRLIKCPNLPEIIV